MPYLPIIAAAICLLLVASVVWTTLRVGISPMPSSTRAIKAMIDLIPEDTSGPIIELGSGWGTLSLAIAKRRSDLKIIGYELSPIPWAWSRLVARIKRGATHLRRDFFTEDLSAATVVLCYLYPGAMSRISESPDLFSPGCVIISNTFRVPGWEPDAVIELGDLYSTQVYRYVVGQAHRQSTINQTG